MMSISSVARGTVGLGLTALSLSACSIEVGADADLGSGVEAGELGQLEAALTGNDVRDALYTTGFVLRYGPSTAESAAMVANLRAQLYQLPVSAQANLAESSYGLVELEVDPAPITSMFVTAPSNCEDSSVQSMINEARARLSMEGTSLAAYNRVHWVFPYDATCSFSAQPLNHTDITYNGSPGARTISHELAHTLGGLHANSYTCGDSRMAWDPLQCKITEYGHPFDSLGSAGRCTQFSAPTKAQLGWFGGCNALKITRSGTFELKPLEAASNGVQMLRIMLQQGECPPSLSLEGFDGCYLNVEYRQPIGQVAGDPGQDPRGSLGLLLNIGPDLNLVTPENSAPGPYLLDMTPRSLWGMFDSALLPGANFVSPIGAKVTLLSKTAERALVKVDHPNGSLGAVTCIDGSPAPAPSTPASCSDGVRNGTETAIDCGGGTCWPCSNGKDCNADADCHNRCVFSLCVAKAPTCTDGIKNGSETAIDCGGGCSTCNLGQACTTGTDCRRGVCSAGLCALPAGTDLCSDTFKNQDESAVDCGGSLCSPCARKKACNVNNDCLAQVCESGLCTFGPK